LAMGEKKMESSVVMVRGLGELSGHESVGSAFGELFGAVRRVDVIRGAGYGFVRFAAAADAKKAIARSRTKGVLVDGAKVTIDVARAKKEKKKKKHTMDAAAGTPLKEEEKQQERPRPPAQAPPRETKARSVRLFGVASSTTEKQLYKRMRKVRDFERVLDIKTVLFKSRKAADDARKRLDGSTFRGAVVKARLVGDCVKPRRVVVRNLPFSATDDDLISLFESFGPLREARVVVTTTDGQETKSRGFGFVEFECDADAERAVKKGLFELKGRLVAVDDALGKSEYQQQQQRRTPPVGASEEEQRNHDKATREEEEEEEEDNGDAKDKDEDDDDEEEEDEEKEKQEEEETRGDAAEGRSVFVRNVPYGASHRSLRLFFQDNLGPVESLHLVTDKTTGLRKGTAFVKLREPKTDLPETLDFENRQLTLSVALVDVSEAKSAGPAPSREKFLSPESLVDEGFVGRGDAAAKDVPRAELDKRERARSLTKKKLTNPLFFVNPYRLSFRNLREDVDDATLRRKIARTAGDVKVVVDAVSKKSKGFGFAEFDSTDAALETLRRVNNNPQYSAFARGSQGGGIPRLIVDFAVENKRKADQRAANTIARQLQNQGRRRPLLLREKDDDDESLLEPPPSKKTKKMPTTTTTTTVSLPKGGENNKEKQREKKTSRRRKREDDDEKGPPFSKRPGPSLQKKEDDDTQAAADIKAAIADGRAARWFDA